jgi:hypothetical protein
MLNVFLGVDMSIEEAFGNLFKPEMKSSARKLLAQEKISLGSHSDSLVEVYVRVSPAFRVKLSAEGISSPSFTAGCSCPVAQKSRFCKHIWAALLCVEGEFPDFLESKKEMNKVEISASDDHADSRASQKTIYAETAKKRASEYRKDQYQKIKARTKEKKRERMGTEKSFENAVASASYTPEVEATLTYFSENGFPMPGGPSRDILAEAKRKLSRVFHPDKGGSHEESVELNRHCDILLDFFRD